MPDFNSAALGQCKEPDRTVALGRRRVLDCSMAGAAVVPAVARTDGWTIPAALSDAIGYSLRLAQEASFAAYLARVGNADLKPGRYSILMILGDNAGITATALSRLLRRDKSTLTTTLRDLQAAGLVSRAGVAGDRRSAAFHLTEAGRELRDSLRQHARAHDAALERIVGADKGLLMEVLHRISTVLVEPEVGG